jgi:hypothetical protein
MLFVLCRHPGSERTPGFEIGRRRKRSRRRKGREGTSPPEAGRRAAGGPIVTPTPSVTPEASALKNVKKNSTAQMAAALHACAQSGSGVPMSRQVLRRRLEEEEAEGGGGWHGLEENEGR